jgi:hypothetical protein
VNRPLPPTWKLRRIAYRVAPMPATRKARDGSRLQPAWPGLALIIETVALNGLSGPARLGSYLLVQGERTLARGFFLGPGGLPDDAAVIRAYSRRLRLEPVLSLEEFLKVLYRYVYKKRLPLVAFGLAAQLARLAVDWTAPEPGSFYAGGVSLILWTRLTRSERRRGERRLRNGGFEDGYRPRVLTKVLADGSVAIGFGARGDPDPLDRIPEGARKPRKGFVFRGHLLPLERLCYGLTGSRPQTLEEACRMFSIDCPLTPMLPVGEPLYDELLDTCLARTHASHDLYRALLERHQAFGLPLAPDQVFSPASYAKAGLEAIGVTPPLERYKGDLSGLGAAACAAYGGWSGVRIRNVPSGPPTPVRLVDINGSYAVCAHRLGIWSLLCAERLTLEPVPPAEIEAWIARQRQDTLELSPQLNVFCRLSPDEDVLPHRIKPARTWITTVAPLTSPESLWWPLADVVNSFLETGGVPKLDHCLRLTGHGRLPALRPVEFPGLGRFDPNGPDADLFLFLAQGRRRLVDTVDLDPAERKRLADLYKLWDNSACSGIFLEVHPQEPGKTPKRGTVIGPDGPYQTTATAFEWPGPWFFPPLYSLVTAAGRLLLQLTMREVRIRGGIVCYWDTDSLAILATLEGGLVPCQGGHHRDEHGRECELALSYQQVDAVRRAMERHSPYRHHGPAERSQATPPEEPTLLRLEPENFAAVDGQVYLFAVASKRKTPYMVGQDGQATCVSPSEFALGHFQPPDGSDDKRWIAEAWAWAALHGPDPGWLDQPPLAHVQLARYDDLSRLDPTGSRGLRPYDTLVVAQVDRLFGRTADGNVPRPVALYQPGFTIERADWLDFTTGIPITRVQLTPQHADERAISRQRPTYLRSYRHLLTAHTRAREGKALGADNTPCTETTNGVLTPMPTHAYTTVPIGRETNYADDAGVLADPDYVEFPNPDRDTTRAQVLAILRAQARRTGGRQLLANVLGRTDSAVRRYLNTGNARPDTLRRALTHAVTLAHQALMKAHPEAILPQDPALLLHLATREGTLLAPLVCEACGRELEGRQQRWCPRCRQQPRLRNRTANENKATG